MFIDLSELLTREDAKLQRAVSLEMKTFDNGLDSFRITKALPVSFTLTNMGDKKVRIDGEAALTLLIPCDRCLDEVPTQFSLSFEREIDFGLPEEERVKQLEETNFLSGYELDADQLVCNELLVNWPVKVLCRDDCKGICPSCGINRNKGECGCEDTALDPRMAVIRDLFEQATKPQNEGNNKEV